MGVGQILRRKGKCCLFRPLATQNARTHGAVQQPRIEVCEPEMIRYRAANRSLARRSGPINGNRKSHGRLVVTNTAPSAITVTIKNPYFATVAWLAASII
ncbi:MAG: hypothetical protein Gyms2KO_33790 [Gymnodinialimonas sp.]